MAKLGITIQEVEGLKANGKLQRIRITDTPNLYIQVAAKNSKSGVPTKSWIFRYEKKFQGYIWITLGKYPDWSIKRATDETSRLREGIRTGQDPRLMIKPVSVPVPEPAPAPAQKTVDDLLDLFKVTMGELRETTRKEYLRILTTKVRKWVDAEGRVFGQRPAVDITGEDAAFLLEACREDAPRTSTIVAIKMHQCWEYGMTLGVLPDKRNIWRGQVRPKIKKKNRYLKEAELVLVGERLRACKETEDCVIAYKLFLLAGMRHRNLAHARWKWVDLEHQEMVIPADQHKTGMKTEKALTVFLSKHAVVLLKRLKQIRETDKETKGTPWLFPMRDDKKVHRDDLGDPWERIRKGQTWSDVNIHDLRRTLASMVSSLGYKAYAGEILGHAEKTVTDIYTRTESEPLLKILDEVGDRITGLMEGTIKPGAKRQGVTVVKSGEPSQSGEAPKGSPEPPVGVKAARMPKKDTKAASTTSKAKLFQRRQK